VRSDHQLLPPRLSDLIEGSGNIMRIVMRIQGHKARYSA
jgi:hypothetical protein